MNLTEALKTPGGLAALAFFIEVTQAHLTKLFSFKLEGYHKKWADE